MATPNYTASEPVVDEMDAILDHLALVQGHLDRGHVTEAKRALRQSCFGLGALITRCREEKAVVC